VSRGTLDRALILSRPHVRFALLLGARAGLRREEIAGLHARHVGRGFLHITGKGGKARRVPIHPDLRPYLAELATADTWAFPSHVHPGQHVTPETICRWCSDALGPPWTTHSLRRRFAVSAYEGTHDLRAVQVLLGHSSPTTTARYIHADDDALTAAVLAVA
jgi:integrase